MTANLLGALAGIVFAASYTAITYFLAAKRLSGRPLRKYFAWNGLLIIVCAVAGWFLVGPRWFGEPA